MVNRKKRTAPKVDGVVELFKGEDESSGTGSSMQRTKRIRSSVNESPSSTMVRELFKVSGIVQHMTTKGGWCLREGMIHILEADSSGRLLAIVRNHGLPAIYSIVKDATSITCRHDTSSSGDQTTVTQTEVIQPQNCFQSLCRIIAGQQLAGAAARAMWHRLIQVTTAAGFSSMEDDESSQSQSLTPESILSLARRGLEEQLRKPAGLSRAKAHSIVALAQAFTDGDLEDYLNSPNSTEEGIRSKLLPIKGIGPWTCDMFLMFYLEKGNVLPVGDLGVRKGISKFFGLKGKGHKGSLCNKKDKDVMEQVMAPYKPYQSLISYYMWAVADTKDFYLESSSSNKTAIPSMKSKAGDEAPQRAVVTP